MDFPIIALLTDFGERDGFVGVIKGVMLCKLDAPAPMVDISHQVEPQNIRQALWILENALPYFPPKTVFVCIVDPGVGTTEQAALLCHWPQQEQIFIGPDNGLLTPVYEAVGADLQVFDIRAAELYKDDQLSLHGRSQTFHGRDVYAPIAALAANALFTGSLEVFLQQFGPPLSRFEQIARQPATLELESQTLNCQGEIVYCDHYGNLITNIPHVWLPVGSRLSISIGDRAPFTCPFLPAYADNETTQPHPATVIAVPSSGGTVELSVFRGNAGQTLKASPAEPIRIQILP